MKKSRNFKTVVIMLCIAGVIVLAYAVQGFYFSYTGSVETEYIFETEDKQVVTAEGFVVRDENRTQNKKNISVLEKAEGEPMFPWCPTARALQRDRPLPSPLKTSRTQRPITKALYLRRK